MSSPKWPWPYRPPKWVLVVFAMLSTATGALIWAAHLTVTVPEAASKWVTWAAPLRPFLPFLYGFLIAWALAFLIILLSARTEKRPAVNSAERFLSVLTFVDNLNRGWS